MNDRLSGERPCRISLRIRRDLLEAAMEAAENRRELFSHLVERALREELGRLGDEPNRTRRDSRS